MDHRLNTPLEQIFWHLSVAIHHVQATLDHAHTETILLPDEYDALEAVGDAICEVMDRLTHAWDGDTEAVEDPPI